MQCLTHAHPFQPYPAGFQFPPGAARRTADPAVLVVEDDPGTLGMISEALAALGHRVVAVADGCSALRSVLHDPSITCLFTDIALPYGMNGVQLMQAARAARPGLRILLTSVHTLNDVAALGSIPNDVAFIPKPYGMREISVHVRGDPLHQAAPSPRRHPRAATTHAMKRAPPARAQR